MRGGPIGGNDPEPERVGYGDPRRTPGGPMLHALPFALLLGVAAPAHAGVADAAPAAAPAPTLASEVMRGDWRILGPASQAHLAQMIRLTMQEKPPTEDAFRATRLDPDQVAQVQAGRARVAKEPESEAVRALTQDWAHLDAVRATIGPKDMVIHVGKTQDLLTYEVLSEEGIRVNTRLSGPDGVDDVLFTLVDQNTLIFGPMGAEPTVLYRVSAP